MPYGRTFSTHGNFTKRIITKTDNNLSIAMATENNFPCNHHSPESEGRRDFLKNLGTITIFCLSTMFTVADRESLPIIRWSRAVASG